VLRKYLDEHLDKGFIKASSSPIAALVIFVKKPGGGLRFYVDYRALNAVTVKNRYPIPLIQETLNQLSKARIYTKLDIIYAFNHLHIAKGDEWLTAFRTRYGLFKYLVMPFGLANAPSSFQHFVNNTLRPYLDIFYTAYIDDILIYSNNLTEHRKHVKLILEALRGASLQLDIDKCEFHKTEVLYLGLIISTDSV
jgi:Reverse transcriptase (RNA-dependent DNA polymerase)